MALVEDSAIASKSIRTANTPEVEGFCCAARGSKRLARMSSRRQPKVAQTAKTQPGERSHRRSAGLGLVAGGFEGLSGIGDSVKKVRRRS